jgi:poly(A) polymerase
MASPADLITIPSVAVSLGKAFAEAGFELHLVGGTVRDALMQRPDEDLDFTTDARPEEILAVVEPLAKTIWTTGIEFGTVSVLLQGRLCEITTYRADRYDR